MDLSILDELEDLGVLLAGEDLLDDLLLFVGEVGSSHCVMCENVVLCCVVGCIGLYVLDT